MDEVRTPVGPGTSSLDTIFRFRYLLHLVVYIAAFTLAWTMPAWLGTQRVWLSLPVAISTHFTVDHRWAILVVTIAATLLALAGAALRTWGTAYLGSTIVFDPSLREDHLVVSGPYRYVRNPLYLGTLIYTLAISVLLPGVAAMFLVGTIAALQAALIAAEERFLATANQHSPAFAQFLQQVPRIVPRLTPFGSSGAARPRWAQAFASQLYMWGVAASFAAFGQTYNAQRIVQGVLVSFGLSIVVRGLTREQ